MTNDESLPTFLQQPCSCKEPGFCPRYQTEMGWRFHQFCQGTSGLRREYEETYLARLYLRNKESIEKAQMDEKENKSVEPPKPATLTKKVFNRAAATIRWIASGRKVVTDDQFKQRLDMCSACPSCDKQEKTWSCLDCGCYLNETPTGFPLPPKARMASEECPQGKWPGQTGSGCNCS